MQPNTIFNLVKRLNPPPTNTKEVWLYLTEENSHESYLISIYYNG